MQLSDITYIEALYQSYLKDPLSVEASWRYFFEGMELSSQMRLSHKSTAQESPDLRVHLLIEAYRKYGHLRAHFNPLVLKNEEEVDELKLEQLGFRQEELESYFPTCSFLKEQSAPLKTIIEALEKTYSASIGVEYVELGQNAIEKWLQERIEPFFPLHQSKEDKLWIVELLNKAEGFETFLHTKYVGQKRFSLEGGETLIPLLAALFETGAEHGVKEATLGMAHRGRLNVLANILNKSYAQLFKEFEAHYAPDEFEGTGDVKYHKGFTGKFKTRQGAEIDLSLVANPSHLEAVDPVIEGIVRARQELRGGKESRKEVLPILIHGDASIAGQGVVYETLQLCRLNGYATGGTLHIVINNQIGFTTLPKDARSTRYCTQVGLSFGAPVFHVNAEDPEGVVRVAKLATELRQTFQCDVFIDLNCYRKYGHNESDEPTFTQPLEYTIIKAKKTIRDLYIEKLMAEGVLSAEYVQELEKGFKEHLHTALEMSASLPNPTIRKSEKSSVKTAVPLQQLIALTENFCSVPPNIQIHPKVMQGVKQRLKMVHANPDEPHIDWGLSEHLAYATLLTEGVHVRLSGQDVRRGTFSHRHAIWVDQMKEQRYFPLAHLSQTQASFDVFNSPLSEYAVLGFEYGYSLTYPRSLVIWEAQFGDFANGAQIVIDQFIAACEQKWGLTSNLTLFLPHGYEGQGPEHSSARIERYLQLAGHENMRIVNCTSSSQLFHLLRLQALTTIKKPLILFTPKLLLRHPALFSALNEFSQGLFHEVIDDSECKGAAKKLYLCSGKVYFDLKEALEKKQSSGIAIVRIEQLYPFPKEQIDLLLKKYSGCEIYWVQEEPKNMGCYDYVRAFFDDKLKYIGRERSASTAAGSYALHKKELESILETAVMK